MSTTNNGVHILVCPFPAQGHMLPLLDLTHQLSLKNLTITILITPKNLPILNSLLKSNPHIKTLILPFPSNPSIPPDVENVKDLGNSGNIPIITALSQLQGEIIQWFKSHSNPPVAILSDFFLGWTQSMAQHIGIPRIVFYSSGAFSTAVMGILWGKADEIELGSELKFEDLPQQPFFTWEQAPSVFRRYMQAQPPRPELVRDSMLANYSSWCSVFNTFEFLEDEFLEYQKKKMGHSRFYSVGPLSMLGKPNEIKSCDESNIEGNGFLSWLDQFDDGSVLYVCFGSQKLLKKAQVDALAIGLEMSGVPFVWVVKPLMAQQVADGFGVVPDGFEDRVADRGYMITGWAPQVKILSHRAVGGFLSHCGWNSVLEAVAAGVMILGWPMEADQFANAKLLVDYRGVSLIVCEDGDTLPDSTELGRKIREGMMGNAIQRLGAKRLKDKALEAVKFGGSSSKDLDGLIQELKLLQTNKKGFKEQRI